MKIGGAGRIGHMFSSFLGWLARAFISSCPFLLWIFLQQKKQCIMTGIDWVGNDVSDLSMCPKVSKNNGLVRTDRA